MMKPEVHRSQYEQDAEIVELRQRLEVLERYVTLSMASSGASWSSEHGLALPRYPGNDTNEMIMGRLMWSPRSLDKGG